MVITAWLVAGVTLVLIAVIEIALLLAFTVKDELGRAGRVDRRVRADTYTDLVGEDLLREERRVRARWHSYVYWRQQPFQGEHVNIDADGIRRTASARHFAISVASGRPAHLHVRRLDAVGKRRAEAFTIPSILARRLQADGVAATVVNMGEVGYVSTQEVIGLLLRLQRATCRIWSSSTTVSTTRTPPSSSKSPVCSTTSSIGWWSSTGPPVPLLAAGANGPRRRGGLAFSVRLLRSLVGGTDQEQQIGVRPPLLEHLASNDDAYLPGAVIARYRGSVELVKAWAAHYRFRAMFYWQPTIFDKPALTAYERTQRERHAEMAPFFRETYDALRRSPAPGADVHDLSGIFADVSLPMYVDWCHLGESGNDAIATRMARDLVQVMAPAPRTLRTRPRARPWTPRSELRWAPPGKGVTHRGRRTIQAGQMPRKLGRHDPDRFHPSEIDDHAVVAERRLLAD